MDQRERLDDFEEALRVALSGLQARLWTALPAKIASFDATKVTCQAQPLIQGNLTDTNGNTTQVTLPVCPDVPIIFPHGGGASLSFPLAVGDEGLLVFASRCIDNWWSLGDIRSQFEVRMHDLSDGFFLPGPYSQPKKPAHPIPSTTRLRLENDTAYYEIDATGKITVVSSGSLNLTATTAGANGDVFITPGSGHKVQLLGNTKVTGDAEITGKLNVDTGPIQIASGAQITRMLKGSGSSNFGGTLPSFTSTSTTITVTGAQTGDFVLLTIPTPFLPLVYMAWVSSTNTVSVSAANHSNVTVGGISTMTLNVLVIGAT